MIIKSFYSFRKLEIDQIYKKLNFNPVELNLNSDIKALKKLFEQRKSLFTNFLKIPINFFREKNILEFGTASGEKSLFYCLNGANITVVETNKKFIKQFKLTNKIKKIYNSSIEKFLTNKKYDLVIAENFLASTAKRKKNLSKCFKLAGKDGLILITNTDRYGYFFDYFKSFILKLYLYKNRIENLNKMIDVSKKFFIEDFKKIKTSRNFDQYTKDQLLFNVNLNRSIWDFKEILNIADKHNFKIYSSWPNYFINTSFYKEKVSAKKINRMCYNEYLNNFKIFFFGKNELKINMPPFLKIKRLMHLMDIVQDDFRKLNLLKIFLTKNKNYYLFQEVLYCINNLNPLSYKKSILRKFWGSPNHYIVFIKN